MGRRSNYRKSKGKSTKESIKVVISCEDSSGALEYIKSLIISYDLNPYDSCDGSRRYTTDAKNLVNFAKESSGKHKFVFFDIDDKCRDDKANLNDAIQIAKSNNICIIFSNEAIELWFLLHFKDVTSFIDRKTIFKELRDFLLIEKSHLLSSSQKVNLQKGKLKSINLFHIFTDEESKTAIKRCKKLLREYKNSKIDICESNPLTLMCIFIDILEKIKKGEEIDCYQFFMSGYGIEF